MIFRYSAIFLLGLLTVTSLASTSVTVEELTNAIGAPKCMQKCMNSFIVNLYDALTNSSINHATKVMCKEYDKFVECTTKDRYVCPYEVVYNFAFEGISSFCSEKETPNSACLDEKLSVVAKSNFK